MSCAQRYSLPRKQPTLDLRELQDESDILEILGEPGDGPLDLTDLPTLHQWNVSVVDRQVRLLGRTWRGEVFSRVAYCLDYDFRWAQCEGGYVRLEEVTLLPLAPGGSR